MVSKFCVQLDEIRIVLKSLAKGLNIPQEKPQYQDQHASLNLQTPNKIKATRNECKLVSPNPSDVQFLRRLLQSKTAALSFQHSSEHYTIRSHKTHKSSPHDNREPTGNLFLGISDRLHAFAIQLLKSESAVYINHDLAHARILGRKETDTRRAAVQMQILPFTSAPNFASRARLNLRTPPRGMCCSKKREKIKGERERVLSALSRLFSASRRGNSTFFISSNYELSRKSGT